MTNDEFYAATAELERLLEGRRPEPFRAKLLEHRRAPRSANRDLLIASFAARESQHIWPSHTRMDGPGDTHGRSLSGGVNRLVNRNRDRIKGVVCNPKIWKGDLRALKRGSLDKKTIKGWYDRMRKEARGRDKGDVQTSTLMRAGEYFASVIQNSKDGWIRKTFDELAFHFGVKSRETARKVVRFFEEAGLIDTFNILIRENDKALREANLYALPDAPPPPEMTWMMRIADRLKRYAPLFGLEAREWGLNATAGFVGIKPVNGHPDTA